MTNNGNGNTQCLRCHGYLFRENYDLVCLTCGFRDSYYFANGQDWLALYNREVSYRWLLRSNFDYQFDADDGV